MSFAKTDVVQVLLSKLGFADAGGTKHEKYRLEIDGQFVAQTAMSRSWRDISTPMITNLAHQIGLTSKEFRMVMDCRMNREKYLQAVLEDPPN